MLKGDNMLSAGIKKLKNNLSRYLSRVKEGEDVLITERGKAIARIIQEDHKKTSIKQALNPLILKGIITLPSRQLNIDIPDPIELPGKPVSEMVIEDRR